MGGKNAITVLEDADLDLAVDGIVWSAFGTSGQRCTACSRVLVHREVQKRLEQNLVHRMLALKLGDGLDPSVDVGPVINRASVEKISEYVRIAAEEGARLLCGGSPANVDGLAADTFSSLLCLRMQPRRCGSRGKKYSVPSSPLSRSEAWRRQSR